MSLFITQRVNISKLLKDIYVNQIVQNRWIQSGQDYDLYLSRPRYDARQHLAKIKSSQKEASILPTQYCHDNIAFTYKYPKYQLKIGPFERALKKFKLDINRLKQGKSIFNDPDQFPNEVDVAIIGGGLVGSSIAYFLKQAILDGLKIVVIERDPIYTHAISSSSFGGIRQQFSMLENVQMSLFGIDFLRNVKTNLGILDYNPPDICFNPHGYLILHNHQKCEEMLNHQQLQNNCGAYIDALSKDELAIRFPWLNVDDDIILGTLGVQDEGWFDPLSLLYSIKAKAEFLGTHYIHGEVIDFNVRRELLSAGILDETANPPDLINHVLVQLPNGQIEQIQFSMCYVAAGAQNKEIIDMLNLYNTSKGVRAMPCPVQPKKRYFYIFDCIGGPGLDFPILVDPSGVICRREGLGDRYIVTKCPTKDEEPDTSDLDVDYNYFENVIKHILKKRVKTFKNIELVSGWASYQDVNTFDECPIIGFHPYYYNMLIAAGLRENSVQMAPAVGRAMSELLLEHKFKTLNLDIFSWDRIIDEFRLEERLML